MKKAARISESSRKKKNNTKELSEESIMRRLVTRGVSIFQQAEEFLLLSTRSIGCAGEVHVKTKQQQIAFQRLDSTKN